MGIVENAKKILNKEPKELMIQLPVDTFNKTLEIIDKLDNKIQSLNSPIEKDKSTKIMNYSKQGASKSVIAFKGWTTELGSPKTDIEDNIELLRERSRDLFHAGSLGAAIPKTIKTNVIGSGLIPKPQIDYEFLGITEEQAKSMQSKIVREWKIFTKECDLLGRDNFEEMQQTALLSQLINGDIGVNIQYYKRPRDRYGTKILLVEADRITTPDSESANLNFRSGVELDNRGQIIAYHVLESHPVDKTTSHKKMSAYGSNGLMNFWLLLDLERPGQFRGVPAIAQAMEKIKQLDRYMNAEIMSAVIGGMFTAVIESEKDEDIFEKEEIDEEETENTDPNTPTVPKEQPKVETPELKLGYGAVLQLAPGQKLSTANPNKQNTGFEAFVKAILQFIGASVELPSELLLKNYDASYSASRGAVLEAEKYFKTVRNKFRRNFCDPVYENFMEEVVANGYIEEIDVTKYRTDRLYREAILEVLWIGPKEGQLNPLAEMKALELAESKAWVTNSFIASTYFGTDYENNLRELANERQKLADIDNYDLEGGEN